MYQVSSGNSQSTTSSSGTTGSSQSSSITGSSNWYQKMAKSWGNALDKQAQVTADLASNLTQGDDAPGQALLVSAAAHKLSFLSTAASTASNSIGQALETLGKKQ